MDLLNYSYTKHFLKALGVFFILAIALDRAPSYQNAYAAACTHYVSDSSGNDINAGSIGSPWKTIQKAANTAVAGNVVCVRTGTYAEIVSINVSGSSGNYITFQNYPSEQAILDGASLTVPSGWAPMIQIVNKEYVIIKGFEIQNYRTSLVNRVPIGIFVSGAGNHIELRDNIIHDIETNYGGMDGGDAHGIAVYGTSGAIALTDIVIDNNQLYDLKLGSSESLVVNGNVDGFEITNNIVHDNNNIGIDAIGFEGTASANDHARNGLISGNTVYNINSFGNPAYGNQRSAGCIYVDGGDHILIEKNVVHHCNVGVELASEHKGKSTSYITLQNNLIHNSTQAGIGIGGYDTQRGSTENSTIVNNTLYNNATQGDWGAELYVQYDTRNNVIQNNIISNPAGRFIESWSSVMSGNSVDYNLYFSTNGSATGSWSWKNAVYSTFSAYQSGSGNDANSLIGADPIFVNVNTSDFQLQVNSPAINAANNATCATTDKFGAPRPLGGACDIGFFESNQYAISGNAGMAYAKLKYIDGNLKTVIADDSGAYILGVPPGWSGVVTPFKSGYIFLPISNSYINISADVENQDYESLAPPTRLLLTVNRVRENQPVGTVVSEFVTVDQDVDDRHVFNLQNGVVGCDSVDNTSFQIYRSQLRTNAIFDYETKDRYNICVRVTDLDNSTLDRSFTIKILNVIDETPPQTSARYYVKKIGGSPMSYVFAFASSEANSRFMCKMDAGAYAVCVSVKLYSKLSQGSHIFYVYAVDASGNADPTPMSINFFVR